MAATVVATVVATVGVAAGPALAAPARTTGHGSAYALNAAGPVAVPAISAVASTGRKADRSLLSLPKNPLVKASALHTTADRAMARASVADLLVKKLGLSASAVTALCTHGKGSVDLVAARLGKQHLAVSPAPNSAVRAHLGPLGTATVTLNKQVRAADGSLRVTAIEARVPIAGKLETVSVSSVTCGKAAAQPTTPAPQQPPAHQAPAPTPVHHDLPVTG
jgi:hypothetical protein